MFLIVLTEDGHLITYDINLERRFVQHHEERHLPGEDSGSNSEMSIPSSKKKPIRKAGNPDDSKAKYRNLHKLYEYKPKQPQVIDLRRQTGAGHEVRFESFLSYNHKSEKYIIVADSEGYLLIFRCKGDKGGNAEFKARVFSGSKSAILGMSRNLNNVLFV